MLNRRELKLPFLNRLTEVMNKKGKLLKIYTEALKTLTITGAEARGCRNH